VEDISSVVEHRLNKLGIKIFNCTKCKKKILFLYTKSGKSMPVTLNLTSHFAVCSKARYIKKKYVGKKSWQEL